MSHQSGTAFRIVIAVAITFSCSTSKANEIQPDIHTCGSEATPVCANRPKVRLFYKRIGVEHPDKCSIFFFDQEGRGFFNEALVGLTKDDVTNIWRAVGQSPDSVKLWGEYAFERVESIRSPYYIDFQFENECLSHYRIRGPHISSPGWKPVKKTEETSK